MEEAVRTPNGVPVPDFPDQKDYNDGLDEGKRIGRQQGFNSGLEQGRNDCNLQRQAEEAEERRQAEKEARRMFWDTAYLSDERIDAKDEAKKADSNLKGFISDVQTMNLPEFLATEKELNDIYEDKQSEWKKNHRWWDIFDPKPESPMVVKRNDGGFVSSIEFPKQAVSLPVTYWNSETQAARIDTLTSAVNSAQNSVARSLAQKSLVEELSKLKIPQIAHLEARQQLKKDHPPLE